MYLIKANSISHYVAKTLIIFILCFVSSCEQDFAPLKKCVESPHTIRVELEKTKVKEVWLNLKLTNNSDNYQLYRDSTLISKGIITGFDTTIYDYNLVPDHQYTYKAYLTKSDTIKFDSSAITLRTKNYVWRSMGFDNKYAIRLKLYDPYLYICAGSDGLWRKDTRNSGQNWEYLGFADSSVAYGVEEVLVYSKNPDWLLVSYENQRAEDPAIFRSLDGGLDWEPADSGLIFYYEGYEVHGRLQKFLQYPNEIVGAGQGVWHTFDFGAFWEEDQSFIGAEPVYAFQNHPIYKNIIWLGGEGLFFDPILGFSTDGGYNWTEIYLGGIVPYDNAVYSMAFDLVDPNIVYVGMQGAIIKTTDGGQTWISPLVTHPQGEFFYSILADHANEWHLWATAGIDIMETWDKGESWQLIENPLPLTTRISDMIWDQSAEVIYLATFHNGVYSLKP